MIDMASSSAALDARPSTMQRVVSSTSSSPTSAASSPSMEASALASDQLSAMDEVSMPATPPDVADLGRVHVVDAVTASAAASVHAANAAKRPELYLSLTRVNRAKLVLSPTDKVRFSEHIADSKKKFADDTAYLPKTSNMGLSDVDAAALLSVNPFNFARPNALSWEDDDVDVDHGRAARMSAKAGKTVFLNAFPCIYVTNLTNSVAFYQKLIGFSPVGKPASHQAIMRRGPAARPPRSAQQQYSAIPSAAEEQGVRIVLRYLPAEWGELKGDGSGPPQLLIVVSNVDELFNEIVAKQQQFKPNGREYFPEVFLGKGKLLGKPQNKPWGTRELHVLDPDANKIIFYHELH